MSEDTPSSEILTEPTVESSSAPTASPAAAENAETGKARQLLGMKGAKAGETSLWKIRLQLMKAITWIARRGSSLGSGAAAVSGELVTSAMDQPWCSGSQE